MVKASLSVLVLASVMVASSAQAQPRGGGREEPYFVDRPEIILFDRPGFQGKSRSWNDDVDDLSSKGFNDHAASVRVRGRWRVCSDSNSRGRCQDVTRDIPDLKMIGMDKAISSVRYIGRRPEPPPPPPMMDRGPPVHPGGGEMLEGATVGLYLRPSLGGQPVPPRQGPADSFCRAAGYGGVLHADYNGPVLRDLVCRR